ncbi:MAG: VWA domain-containing protein [Verrucomicrobiota bacterium]
MSPLRRRLLLVARSLLVILVLLAMSSPAQMIFSRQQAVIFVLDHTGSIGQKGLARIYEASGAIEQSFGGGVDIGFIAAGKRPTILSYPGKGNFSPSLDEGLVISDEIGSSTNYEAAVQMAKGLFPAGRSRHVVLVGDGMENSGSLIRASKVAAISDIKIHTLGVSGEIQPDVRVSKLTSSRSRLNEGASLDLTAGIEGSISGPARIRLFENGVEVAVETLSYSSGETTEVVFTRSPEKRNIYNYRVAIEGFEGIDVIPENNEALSIVDVRGKPLVLYIEGEEGESHYLTEAMRREGIRLEQRSPQGFPDSLQKLAGYDGIVLSDVPAHELGDSAMESIRDYVEMLGGGLVMVGGMNSFGVGGYYRTPIEKILPVKLKAPDQEEEQSSALALVIDRSGSMAGEKIEICKAAAIATAELLSPQDSIGVYAFDSQVHEVVPMTKVTSTSAIASQIALLGSGGGTNIYPGMVKAREELNRAQARIRHMIVLTDGQTSGQGYQALASRCHAEGITISTVAVGGGAQIGLLQAIAAAGGGQSYITMDPTAITRIFTQDTMTHTGRMIREDAFQPKLVEAHPMLKEWSDQDAPPLLGYVKTNRRSTSQVPLVTDRGDPLLAHWRFGLGKVTAFTSDCKSRWAALWISGWPGYSTTWSQILRETIRTPQGGTMDLRLEDEDDELIIRADLIEDAGTRRQGATVQAEVFFVSSHSITAGMEELISVRLEQVGPGRYEAVFQPSRSGVYLVRARSGAQMVSAGYVHNPSSEVATGETNETLLREASRISGGEFLESSGDVVPIEGVAVSNYREWWPLLILLFLAVWCFDLAVRRWENVLGVLEQGQGFFRGRSSQS